MARHALLSLALLFLAVACGGPAQPSAERLAARAAEDTVAIFDGGRITAEELDQAILARPAKDRHDFGSGDLDAFRELLRSLAIDRLLQAEAEDTGFAKSPEYTAALAEMYRQVLVRQSLTETPPPFETPTEAEIRQRYEETAARPEVGDQRFVYTIFRRRPPDADPSPQVAELESLRQRVLAGESFELLAREHSDSETRHVGGALGWVTRGQLSPDLDRVLFELEEGVPSEPIVSAEGVHLFFIATGLSDTIPSFETVRESIQRTLVQERQLIALQELVDSTALPADAFVPDRDELAQLMEETDPGTAVLRLGDFELTRGQLERKVATEQRRSDADTSSAGNLTHAIFNGIRQREVLFHRFHRQGETLRPEVRQRFDDQAKIFLVDRYTEHLLDQELDRREAELRAFHELHRRRFVSPLELRLEALVVPLGDRPAQTMAALETRSAAVAARDLTLEDLARELGGEVQTSDWVDLDRLAMFRAQAAFFAPSLPVGGVSPAYNSGRAIEIFRVLERREPSPLAYEVAREAVRAAYRAQHGQELYQDLVDRRLQDAQLEILEDRLVTVPAM